MNVRTAVILALIGLLLSAGSVFAYGGPTGVRVIHALSGAPEADIYVNDWFVGTVGYGAAGAYVQPPAGAVTVRVFAPGSTGTPLFEGSFTLEAGQHVNAALLGTLDAPALTVFAIDRSPLDYGMNRLRIVHALAGGDPVTITTTGRDGAALTLAENLTFGAENLVELPAGQYIANAGAAGEIPLNLNGDLTTTVFILSGANGAEVRAFTNTTEGDGASGYVRFVHALAGGGAVDLYLDDTLVVPAIDFGGSTVYVSLQPGTYSAAVFPAAADPASSGALLSGDLVIAADRWQTGLVIAGAEGAEIAVYTDDLSVPPAGASGLALLNLVDGAVDFAIDGTAAVSDLAFGALSERLTLSAGAHDLTAAADGAALAVSALNDFSVSPVTIANLKTIVITTDNLIVLTDCPLGSGG